MSQHARLSHDAAFTPRNSTLWRLGFIAIVLAAVIVGNHNSLQYLLHVSGLGKRFWSAYSYWTLKPNYFNSGFVRRGLPSSVFFFINHGSAMVATIKFALLCAAWLALPICLILWSLYKTRVVLTYWLAFVLLISPQLFRFWGTDIPRPDTFICGFIAWAFLATLNGRYFLAVLTLLIGSLGHEAALIMGVPLCATFWFLDWRDKATKLTKGLGAAGFLLVGFIAIALAQRLLGADPLSLTRTINTTSPAEHAEWLSIGQFPPQFIAAYVTAGGLRAVKASVCTMWSFPGAFMLPIACFFTLASYVLVFLLRSRRELVVFGCVSFFGAAFLSAVAIDFGRWEAYAVFNGWLATAGLAIRRPGAVEESRSRYAVAFVAVLALVGLGTADDFVSNSRVDALAIAIYGEPPNPIRYQTQCDPGWLRVAHGDLSK